MISRQWCGVAHANQAQNYVEHLHRHTFPMLREIPGFVDASILSRTVGNGVEFLVVTRWDSLEAITQFSGSDPETAVVPAEVATMMVEYDRRVRHFEVMTDEQGSRACIEQFGPPPGFT
jgi:heme-degrading monooxygenase HmoA